MSKTKPVRAWVRTKGTHFPKLVDLMGMKWVADELGITPTTVRNYVHECPISCELAAEHLLGDLVEKEDKTNERLMLVRLPKDKLELVETVVKGAGGTAAVLSC